jgi:hypothetical protein
MTPGETMVDGRDAHPQVEGHGPLMQTTRALGLHRHIDREGWKILFLAPWGFP